MKKNKFSICFIFCISLFFLNIPSHLRAWNFLAGSGETGSGGSLGSNNSLSPATPLGLSPSPEKNHTLEENTFIINSTGNSKVSEKNLGFNPSNNTRIVKTQGLIINTWSNLYFSNQNNIAPIKFNKELNFSKAFKLSISSSYRKYQLIPNIIIVDDLAYSLNAQNQLIIVNLSTKKIVEKISFTDFKGQKTSGLALDGDYLYLTFESGDVLSFSLISKTVLWQNNIGFAINSVPVIDENKLFFTSNNTIYALDIYTGKILWKFAGSKNGVSLKQLYSLTVYSGYLMVGLSSSDFLVLRKENGTLVWKENILGMNLFSVTANPLVGDIKSPIIGIGQNALVISNNKISYFNIVSKSVIWQNNTTGSNNAPLIFNDQIIITDVYNNLISLNITDGKQKWQTPLVSNKNNKSKIFWFTPIIINQEIVVNNSIGEIKIINIENGTIKADAELYKADISAISNFPAFTSNYVVYLSTNGDFYIYN
ncbi:BamB/YfgL-like protein [Candidatus Hepatincolaceae symbiont of Richtersius coronifer]